MLREHSSARDGPCPGDVRQRLARPPRRLVIEQGNNCLATFKRKPFLSQVFRVQKTFELFGRDQFPEQLFFYLNRNGLG